jgi:tetratricopeptide (TPR) repeat protein
MENHLASEFSWHGAWVAGATRLGEYWLAQFQHTPLDYSYIADHRQHFWQAIENCQECRMDEMAIGLVLAGHEVMIRLGYWGEWAGYVEWGLAAASALGVRCTGIKWRLQILQIDLFRRAGELERARVLGEKLLHSTVSPEQWLETALQLLKTVTDLERSDTAVGLAWQAIRSAMTHRRSDYLPAFLTHLARAYTQQRRHKRSVACLEQALTLCDGQANTEIRAEILLVLANCYHAQHDHEQAYRMGHLALALCRQHRLAAQMASVLHLLGSCSRVLGYLDKTEQYIKEGLALCRRMSYAQGEARHLLLAADLAHQRGHLARAYEIDRQQILPLAQRLQDKALEATTWHNLAYHHFLQGENAEALRYWTQSYQVACDQGDVNRIHLSLISLAELHLCLGHAKKAVSYAEEAICRSADRQQRLDSLFRLALAQAALGRFQEAIHSCSLAEAELPDHHPRSAVAEHSFVLAIVTSHARLAGFCADCPLPLFQQAEARLADQGHYRHLGDLYENWATYLHRSQPDAVDECHEQWQKAVIAYRQAHMHHKAGAIQQNLLTENGQ